MDKALKREASLALTGAEYVKEKIIALAGLGPTSLYGQVYAIKIRVKSLDSLVEKVKEKKKKKAYKPADATDIVGMRLLCLYAEDLPRITKALIRFLRFCQKPEIRLIEGVNLDQAIREIKVFKSNRNARVYDTVFQYCKQLNDFSDKSREEKVSLIDHEANNDDEEEKSYSSIHFVCNAISHASGEEQIVPIEIQVRTIFEDTWGEIDHSLEYKMKQRLKRPLKSGLVPVHKSYRGFLNQLKVHLENAGSLAEKLRNGYSYLYEAVERKSTPEQTFHMRRIYWGHSFEESIPKETFENFAQPKKLESVLARAKELRSAVLKKFERASKSDRFLKLLELQVSELDECLALIGNGLNPKEKEKEKERSDNLLYFLKMEKAICYLWESQVLKAFHPLSVDDTIGVLDRAKNIYFQLEKNSNFTADSMLNFRLGCTMRELGMAEAAEFFLNRSLDNIEDDDSITDSPFRAIIPHFYSYVVWKKRASLLDLGIKSGNARINAEDQKNIVLNALYYGLTAQFRLKEIKGATTQMKRDMSMVISNNLVSYVWEIFELSFTPDEALEDIHNVSDYIQMDLADYRTLNIKDIAKPMLRKSIAERGSGDHDTLMKYYHILGNPQKVRLHKKTTRDLMKTENIQRKEGLNELYWYAQSRVDLFKIPAEMADGINI